MYTFLPNIPFYKCLFSYQGSALITDLELLYINASTLDWEYVMASQWFVNTATPISPVVAKVNRAVKRLQTILSVFPIFLLYWNQKRLFFFQIGVDCLFIKLHGRHQ